MGKCRWCLDGGILEKYHDDEWGIIIHDDQKHLVIADVQSSASTVFES